MSSRTFSGFLHLTLKSSILTLVNNWVDYGGMDDYIIETTNATYMNETEHTDFYTYGPIVDLFDAYAREIVTRYRNSSTIFAWELANEPLVNSYPGVAASNASAAEITKWVADRSAYIKSLDSQHMVCIGCVACSTSLTRRHG